MTKAFGDSPYFDLLARSNLSQSYGPRIQGPRGFLRESSCGSYFQIDMHEYGVVRSRPGAPSVTSGEDLCFLYSPSEYGLVKHYEEGEVLFDEPLSSTKIFLSFDPMWQRVRFQITPLSAFRQESDPEGQAI